MLMTDEQRYSAVLKELGEVLTDKNTTISCQRWQIDELKAKLEAAEKEIVKEREYRATLADACDAAEAECHSLRSALEAAEKNSEETCSEDARGNGKTWWLLDKEALDALRNVNETLRECHDAIFNSNVSIGCLKELEAAQKVLQSVFPLIGGAA